MQNITFEGDIKVVNRKKLQHAILTDGRRIEVEYSRRHHMWLQRDIEWENAENSDDEECYYLMSMYNGGSCIKKYKPEIAKLVCERTGLKVLKKIS